MRRFFFNTVFGFLALFADEGIVIAQHNLPDSIFISPTGGRLGVGDSFPHFSDKDMHGNRISDSVFYANNCSALMFWDRVKPVKSADTKRKKYETLYNTQIVEIFLALDSICNLNSVPAFSFTRDPYDSVTNYGFNNIVNCIRLIPNTREFQTRLNILEDPVIFLINRKGVIAEILTPFDFPETSLTEFLRERIGNMSK